MCDLCGANVALEQSLTTVKFNDKPVLEVCFNCGSALQTSFNEGIAKRLQTPTPAEEPVVEPTPTEPEAKPSETGSRPVAPA